MSLPLAFRLTGVICPDGVEQVNGLWFRVGNTPEYVSSIEYSGSYFKHAGTFDIWELYDDNQSKIAIRVSGLSDEDFPTATQFTQGLQPGYGGTVVIEKYFVGGVLDISDIYELQAIAFITGGLAGHYTQTHPIDTSPADYNSPEFDVDTWGDYEGFFPIGTLAAPFTGTYNGQNKPITGLFIERLFADYVGLFGRILNSSAVAGLWNVRLMGANVTGRNYVGALFGQNQNTTKDCYVNNVVITGRDFVGGVGLLQAKTHNPEDVSLNVILENAEVNGRASVGIFSSQTQTFAENCHAIGTNVANVATHNAHRSIGGFGATVNMGTFKRCSVVGTINVSSPTNASETNVGGWGGRANGATYEDCFARVTVNLLSGSWTGTTYASDFTARCITNPSTWTRCYAVGILDTFFGENLIAGSIVENCFFEGTDDKNDRGAIGRTQAKMKDVAFYPGWNFRTLWDITPTENDAYPYLNPRKAPQAASPGLYRSLYRKR